MTGQQPLCRVLENAIFEMCAGVERGAENTDSQKEDRARMLLLCAVLPLTCRELRDEASQHEALLPTLFYERVRHGWSTKNYFLDGLPSSVTLFAGDTSIVLPDEQLRKMRLKSIVLDKRTTIMKIENATPARRAELTRDYSPADLHRSVPGCVRVFIARCRSICKGVRRVRNESVFSHCSNVNCARLFYVGEESECWTNADSVRDVSDSEEESSSSEYWSCAACDPGVHVPSVRRFCCSACEREFGAHLARVMPGIGIEFDADNNAVKVGRARVAEALKLSLKRNEKMSRQLRLLRSAKRARLAVSDAELAVLVERHVAALNVDLGVLYAASIVAESSVLANKKLLPGSQIYWRDNPACYSKAIRAVREIYFKHRRREGIVSCLLVLPRFLQLVADSAAKVF